MLQGQPQTALPPLLREMLDHPLPVPGAVEKPFEKDGGLDQVEAAQLEPAGKERPGREARLQPPHPHHLGLRAAKRVAEAHIARDQPRARQKLEAEIARDHQLASGRPPHRFRERRLVGVPVDERGTQHHRRTGEGDEKEKDDQHPTPARSAGDRRRRRAVSHRLERVLHLSMLARGDAKRPEDSGTWARSWT